MLEIREISDCKIWNDFVKASPRSSFLQSFEWGDFSNQELRKKVWRLGFFNGSTMIAVCQALEETTRFGKYVYCPRGPVVDWNSDVAKEVLISLTGYFSGKGYLCLRNDPAIDVANAKLTGLFSSCGYRPAVSFVQVENTWILDLDKSEEELLAGMRTQTRYNVRHAVKKSGLDISISNDEKQITDLVDLLHSVSAQKGFNLLPKEYMLKQFRFMAKSGIFNACLARHDGVAVSGVALLCFGDEAAYTHGGSDRSDSKLRASYPLQWEAIKFAKSAGCRRYNFWGVVSEKNYHPGHPRYGYSNFKKGFGGHGETYMRTQDYVYDFKYNLLRLQELYRSVRYPVL